MSKIGYLFTFALGAVGGSFLTWRYLKSTYEELAQDEIDSVKEAYKKLKEKDVEQEPIKRVAEPAKDNFKKPNITEYTKIIEKTGYTNYSDVAANEKEKKVTRPYVISPDEYGDNDDYEQISLTYYSNNVLTDENDDVIDDVDETVGIDSLTHFGEYEDDSVFVRNDERRCDYEILLDQRPYSKRSRRTEDE